MRLINELALSKDLISFPSITPVDAGAINFLAKKLRALGFKCKILEFKKGKGKPKKPCRGDQEGGCGGGAASKEERGVVW